MYSEPEPHYARVITEPWRINGRVVALRLRQNILHGQGTHDVSQGIKEEVIK